MSSWLKRAREMANQNPSPGRLLASLEQALKRSTGVPTSAREIDLRDAVRRRGMETSGAGYARSEAMVNLGTRVCWILMGWVIAAANRAWWPSDRHRAARVLQSLPTYFHSVHYLDTQAEFLVHEDCFQRLMQESNAARKELLGVDRREGAP